MRCADCRDVISARLDGEEQPGEAVAVDVHLRSCPACRRYADHAARITRLMRLRVAQTGPDLVASVLAAAPSPPPRHRVAGVLRLALGAVGIGQLALAVTGVVTAGAHSHDGVELAGASAAHFAHESSAWNLALAVGFLLAAAGASRVAGLVPVLGAFVGTLAVLSVLDVLGGRVDPERLVTHGIAVAGLVLIIVLPRVTEDGGGGARSGAASTSALAPAVGPARAPHGPRRGWRGRHAAHGAAPGRLIPAPIGRLREPWASFRRPVAR